MPSTAISPIEGLDETGARLQGRPEPAFRRLHDDLELSFEFFPPSGEQGSAALWDCMRALQPLAPRFVSVTYGAGGTTQTRTLDAVRRIATETPVPVAGHLTCVGAPRASVDAVVEAYAEAGVKRIVALRGDAPKGAARFEPHPQGYQGAPELVAAIARRGDFDISVGCYPEVHPDARSAQADLDHLKRKIDAGASRAISQFFFDPEVFVRFVERARAAGISVPIVPGIFPVHSFSGLKRFAAGCGATVPAWMHDLFEPLEQAPELRPLVAATVCAELCTRLRDRGVREFHFYTLNRPELPAAVCHLLGRRVSAQQNAAVQAVNQ
jgi:methylenetetrahydrofolate reductase (NADPH)